MKKLLLTLALLPALSFAAPTWEKVDTGGYNGVVMRLSTPTGWLVRSYSEFAGMISKNAIVFIQDENHTWDTKLVWEKVTEESGAFGLKTTLRLSVPHGWLIRDVFSGGEPSGAVTFLPDENHSWSLA